MVSILKIVEKRVHLFLEEDKEALIIIGWTVMGFFRKKRVTEEDRQALEELNLGSLDSSNYDCEDQQKSLEEGESSIQIWVGNT